MVIEWSVDTTLEHAILWSLIASYLLLWIIVTLWIARRATHWIDRRIRDLEDPS